MKKYYIPTSSLNFNNIFSSESISPYGFYSLRNFGYSNCVSILENPIEGAILLYEELKSFARPISNVEDHPMVIEIETDETFLTLQDGVFYSTHTIYLDPWHTKVYFFTEQDKTIALSLSEHSLETKMLRLYKKSMKVHMPHKKYQAISDFDNISISVSEIEKDVITNKIKGLLYGYYIGAALSTSIENAKQIHALLEINDIASAILSNPEKIASESQIKSLLNYLSIINQTHPLYQDLLQEVAFDNNKVNELIGVLNKHNVTLPSLKKRDKVNSKTIFIMNYSVEYFTLPLTRRPLTYNDLEDFDRVKVLNITHNVLFDYDCGGHFACMKSLKAFRVALPCTMYHVRDGVLYSKDDLYKDYFKECGFTIEDDEEILMEVPPAYPGDTFVVPEGVTVIYHGAFTGTSFKSIILPKSLKVVGFHALDMINGLECINVPNKDVHLFDQLTYDKPIIIKNNTNELDENLRKYWEFWLNPSKDFSLVSEFGSSDSDEYVYPLEGMRELIESLSTKEAILDSLETIGKKYPNHAEFMRAMILLHTDVTLLHSNSDDEALRIIRNIWGDEQSAKNSVLDHVNLESITRREDLSDFEDLKDLINFDKLDENSWGVEKFLEQGEDDFLTYDDDFYPTATRLFFGTDDLNHELFMSAQLATSAPMLFLDTLGGKFIRDNVLIPSAIDILKALADNGDEFAATNLARARETFRLI